MFMAVALLVGQTAVVGSEGTLTGGTTGIVVPYYAGSRPANEVITQPLAYGGTYSAKVADIKILEAHPEVKGFLFAINSKTDADFAIVEIRYWQSLTLPGGTKPSRLLRRHVQVVSVFRDAFSLGDEVPLDPADVFSVTVRLVSDAHVAEFWNGPLTPPVK
jgi:hypothetical protein